MMCFMHKLRGKYDQSLVNKENLFTIIIMYEFWRNILQCYIYLNFI